MIWLKEMVKMENIWNLSQLNLNSIDPQTGIFRWDVSAEGRRDYQNVIGCTRQYVERCDKFSFALKTKEKEIQGDI